MRRAMSEFEVQSGKHMLTLSSSQFDPDRTSDAQQSMPELTLTRISPTC
jgi:hypothetical protein